MLVQVEGSGVVSGVDSGVVFANPISSVSCSILGPQLVESGMDTDGSKNVDFTTCF